MSDQSLARTAAPLMVSFTLRFLFTFVDMAFAARLEEQEASVAAIGYYAPFAAITIAVWVGTSAGFTAALSAAFGARDETRIAALKRSLLGILAVLIPVVVACGAGVWLVAPHLGLEQPLMEAFRVYGTTVMVGMSLTGFWAIYPDSIIKAHQDMRSTMIAGLLSTGTNVVLNALFVFVFSWGLFGIALATVVSRLPSLIYAIARAAKLEGRRDGAAWPAPAPQAWPSPARTIAMLAVPGALTHLLQASEYAVINRLLTDLPDSTRAIASWGVFERMLSLSIMPAVAASVAVVPWVALRLPRGETARIRRELRSTTLAIVGVSVTLTVVMGWLFAEPLAGFFLRGDGDTAGPGPLVLGALALLPLGTLGIAPFMMLRPVFEAALRPRLGIYVSVLRYVVFSLPLLFIGRELAPRAGLTGLQGIALGLATAGLLAAIAVIGLAHRTLHAKPA
ncbi:MAG: MATE family efflux transporter [Planctomycetota bacterium]